MENSAMDQYPGKMEHPWHQKHPLQILEKASDEVCRICGELIEENEKCYGCSICDNFTIHLDCGIKNPVPPKEPVVVNRPKIHEHPLVLFPRQISFICDVCRTEGVNSPLVCHSCCFMMHKDCINFTRHVQINRHHHRISHTVSLDPQGVRSAWSCGVCHRSINKNYGAYKCGECSSYAVHISCAKRKDVWDEGNLEPPLVKIEDDTIKHFSHEEHMLRLTIVDDGIVIGSECCSACNLHAYTDHFYKCVELECNFILHKTCAELPRKVSSRLHPHPLTLYTHSHSETLFTCGACDVLSHGFRYSCKECDIDFDTKCGSTPEPFHYIYHEHPLHSTYEDNNICFACVHRGSTTMMLGCVECDFTLCFSCATLPQRVNYEDDSHLLSLNHSADDDGENWCDNCERKVDPHRSFYECSRGCGTVVHVKCALGGLRNLRVGFSFNKGGYTFLVVSNNNPVTQLSCNHCRSCTVPSMLECCPVNGGHNVTYFCSVDCLLAST